MKKPSTRLNSSTLTTMAGMMLKIFPVTPGTKNRGPNAATVVRTAGDGDGHLPRPPPQRPPDTIPVPSSPRVSPPRWRHRRRCQGDDEGEQADYVDAGPNSGPPTRKEPRNEIGMPSATQNASPRSRNKARTRRTRTSPSGHCGPAGRSSSMTCHPARSTPRPSPAGGLRGRSHRPSPVATPAGSRLHAVRHALAGFPLKKPRSVSAKPSVTVAMSPMVRCAIGKGRRITSSNCLPSSCGRRPEQVPGAVSTLPPGSSSEDAVMSRDLVEGQTGPRGSRAAPRWRSQRRGTHDLDLRDLGVAEQVGPLPLRVHAASGGPGHR